VSDFLQTLIDLVKFAVLGLYDFLILVEFALEDLVLGGALLTSFNQAILGDVHCLDQLRFSQV